jgi:hypothetical protein
MVPTIEPASKLGRASPSRFVDRKCSRLNGGHLIRLWILVVGSGHTDTETRFTDAETEAEITD